MLLEYFSHGGVSRSFAQAADATALGRWRIVAAMMQTVAKISGLLLSLLLLSSSAWAAEPFRAATREQVEQLLATRIASGSSAATVAQFLQERAIAHNQPVLAGQSVVMTARFANLASADGKGLVTLFVRFSFLQDRLIGYSFAEQLPVPQNGR
jgi:hypothetical protein